MLGTMHWAFCIAGKLHLPTRSFTFIQTMTLAVGVTGFGVIWDPTLGACTVDFGRAHSELLAFYLYSMPPIIGGRHYADRSISFCMGRFNPRPDRSGSVPAT